MSIDIIIKNRVSICNMYYRYQEPKVNFLNVKYQEIVIRRENI